MPFDPNLPVNHARIVASELRSQFNGIVDLIQAIPVGPAGPQGVPGISVSGAVVDGVTTVGPLEPAAAGVSFDGANVRFTFSIPRGPEGAPGGQGVQGIQGDVGPAGPAFTSFVVDGVTTLDPAQPATVAAVYDGTNVKLSFGIPRGQQGIEGRRGLPVRRGQRGRPVRRGRRSRASWWNR